MIIKLYDGPMDGAEIKITTTTLPNGLWYNSVDNQGREIQHQYVYKETRKTTFVFNYEGQVIITNIEVETQ